MSEQERPDRFEVAEVPKTGLMDRLRGRVPKDTVFVELRNLLATTPFRQVTAADVSSILARGKLQPIDVVGDLSAVYEQAVRVLANDKELGTDDLADLAHLAHCFELPQAETLAARERAVSHVYEAALREALSDWVLVPGEKTRLDGIGARLGLGPEQRTALYAAAATKVIQVAFDAVLADRNRGGDTAVLGRPSGGQHQARRGDSTDGGSVQVAGPHRPRKASRGSDSAHVAAWRSLPFGPSSTDPQGASHRYKAGQLRRCDWQHAHSEWHPVALR